MNQPSNRMLSIVFLAIFANGKARESAFGMLSFLLGGYIIALGRKIEK